MRESFAPRSNHARLAWTTFAIAGAAFGYAVLRYVVLGTTPVAQIPVYVTNKAIAVTALALLGLAITGRTADVRRARGYTGAALAVLHVLLTVTVMSPASFGGLYSGAMLTAAAGVAVLLGAAAFVALLSLVYPAAPWRIVTRTRLSLVALVLIGGHVLALGGPGWRIRMDRLPAISLLSFFYVVSVLGARAMRRLPKQVRHRADARPLAIEE